MESIAIVVTAHNCGPLLTQALDSVTEALAVFQRDFPQAPVEVAIVDDGSRDDTEARARQAAEGRTSWQVLHRAEASSPAAARNHGARHVQGDLLFFLDGDDRFLPGHLSACYRAVVVEGLDFVKQLRRAVALRPDHAAACTNLGLALTEAGQPGEAAVLLEQAVRLGPKHKEAHNNLGLAYAALGRYEEALACHDEALRLDPRYVEAHTNRGSACKELGRLEEAIACYDLALLLNPQSAIAHYNRALTLLQAGDHEHGWAEYEWRWQRPQTVKRALPQPRWDGSPLNGRTILVWMEQGLGDRIQFLRYVPLLQARGGRVLVECPASLHPLFSTCRGIDALVAEQTPLPAFDVQVPLMSLPGVLKTTLSSIPASVPYLEAEPARVASWRERLADVKSFKVGVVWQGNPRHVWDRHRSFALWRLAPLAAVPGVQLVSLQKGPGSEQVKESAGFPLRVLEGLDEGCGTFQDTAAVLRCLDLVVCADTAVAHLAGALGVPVWLALARVADWRWGRERETAPWYPSMRLFRQQRVGEWGPVFERIAGEPRRHCASGAKTSAGPRVEVSVGELLDKISILEIKSERLQDEFQRKNVRTELAELERVREERLPESAQLTPLREQLRAVNEALWEIEEQVRFCERDGDFGPRFIELARAVYRNNDRRAALKRQMNELLGSRLIEEKSYQPSPS